LRRLLKRIYRFFEDIKEGIHWGYPLCCIFYYAAHDLLGGSPHQAIKRGSFLTYREDGSAKAWVACKWCMGKEGWESYPDRFKELNNLD
jgi:hypothetical protein